MTSMQPQNMLRLSAFLSCSQPRWPFFQRHFGEDTPCPSPNCPTHIHTPVTHSTPCWVLDCGVERWWGWWGGGLCECEARKGPAMVFLLCDGWLGGWTGLFCMRREASRGENRGLFNEACHPKPPSCTEPSHPTPSSSIPSSFRPSSSSLVLPRHLGLLFFLHFVAFICPSSLLLSHPILYTQPPLRCPPYFLISSHLISVHSDFPSFPSSCFYLGEFHNIWILSLLCGHCEWEAIMEMSWSKLFNTKRSHVTWCSDMLSESTFESAGDIMA